MGSQTNVSQEDTTILPVVVDWEKKAAFWKTIAVFFIALLFVYGACSFVDKLEHAATKRQLHALQDANATLNAMAEARPAATPDRTDPE